MLNLTDMKKRRSFDRWYKQMVVELANIRENISALAAKLDLRPELIYRWRREALANKGASFPGQGNKMMTEVFSMLAMSLRICSLHINLWKEA